MNLWIIIWLLCLGSTYSQQYHKRDLNLNWTMKILDGPEPANKLKGKSFTTSIPTTLHLDLQQAGSIPNPLLADNHPQLKYLSECQVMYSTQFTISQSQINFAIQRVTFQGIDTYSDVFLNEKLILSTENAFREYSVELTGLLREGQNKIQVRINSSVPHDKIKQNKNKMPFEYAHTRKACYQYSWDWAPYLNTIGVWKPVFLEFFKEVKLNYVWARTRKITSLNAVVNFAIALDIPHAQTVSGYEFQIWQNGEKVSTFPAVELHTYQDIQVPNPRLWWPNGIGEPYIYDFQLRLIKLPNRDVLDQRKIPFGIRTVELDLKDKKFQVIINGYPIYCKGGNWVPPDMLYPRLQNSIYKPVTTIESLLDDAVASNYNMIRVWGGGQYESDKFLELASRKGIMLFYDFMFSDSIYPSTESFLINVQEEIKQQIRRARNYPALTLWAGNNEILQGIQDWGWSSTEYKNDYHRLFELLIPKIVQYESPYIPYIPSSPIYGVGNYNLERGGDVHYWGVWAGASPFETYEVNVGRFNSEFGTQALPVWETIIEGMTQNPSYDHPTMLLHEKHNSRFSTLTSYMNQYMKKSLNFELETYQSGLLQAYAIELAIKAQRSDRQKSAGTLIWQFNDAWPAISWSGIDYFGRWKPMQYMERRLYPDVAIFVVKSRIFAVNDKPYQVTTLVIIKFFQLDGKVLSKVQKEVTLKPYESKIVHLISPQNYSGQKPEECMIYTEIVAGKNQTMSSTYFPAKFKNLKLFPAEVEITFHTDFNLIVVETKTTVVKNLFISRKSKYLKTSNNYFDLVPGHPVKVQILSSDPLSAIKDDLVFRSYREVYETGSAVKVIVK